MVYRDGIRLDPSLGYVVEFTNVADKGKTLAMVATIVELIGRCGYVGDDVHANMEIRIPGVHQYDNAGIRLYLREVLKMGVRHKIIVMDEIEGIFPARAFKDKLQTSDLNGLWQMTKMEHWLLFTCHKGTVIDKIIRDCTQISVEPEYDEETDILRMDIINGVDNEEGIVREVFPASEVMPLYDRFAPVV